MPENNLEQEIAQIEQNLAAKRVALEQQKISGEIPNISSDKESLHEIVGEHIKTIEPTIEQPPFSVPPQSVPAPNAIDESSYLSEILKPHVQQLIDLAFNQHKSIDKAISLVKGTGNAALIDAFHDALVDELYDAMIERGMLKKL